MNRPLLTTFAMAFLLCVAASPSHAQEGADTPSASPEPVAEAQVSGETTLSLAPAQPLPVSGLPAPPVAVAAPHPVVLGPTELGLDGPALQGAPNPMDLLVLTVIAADGSRRDYRPDASGSIVVEGLPLGPVGLVATGPQIHAATATYIHDTSSGQSSRRIHLPLMRISPELVLKHVRGYLNPTLVTEVAEEDYVAPEDFPVPGPESYSVHLGPDGTLQGRLESLVQEGVVGSDLSGTNITLLSPTGAVIRSMSDVDGYFELPGVVPGPHGFIAAGPAGYVAYAIDVLPPIEASPGVRPVSLRVNQPVAGGSLRVVLIPPPMIPALIEAVETAYIDLSLVEVGPPLEAFPPGPPFGPPGAAGGFGPGGGFGGGAGGGGIGGGLGGIGALAALAALPFIIDELDDDDEDEFVPVAASPAIVVVP